MSARPEVQTVLERAQELLREMELKLDDDAYLQCLVLLAEVRQNPSDDALRSLNGLQLLELTTCDMELHSSLLNYLIEHEDFLAHVEPHESPRARRRSAR